MSLTNLSIAAPLPPPTTPTVSAQSLATSISLTWEQLLGADAIESFEITYRYVINECVGDGDNRFSLPVTSILTDGMQRSYMIVNSSITPVEEDSQYNISVRAMNSVGMSAESNNATTTTSSAGDSKS